MREIKFRGKRVDNGERVYGYYGEKLNVNTGEEETFIIVSTYTPVTNSSYFVDYQVIPETVGQYTGLCDKNGKEIYEGDIAKANDWTPQIYQIEFIEGGFCATYEEAPYPIDINHFYDSKEVSIEVIGNIYENKLLESE